MRFVKHWRTILASLNACLINLVLGTCIGWSSPTIPKLRDHSEDSPLDRGVTTAEEGWLNSLLPLGAFVSSFIAGPTSGWIGRKPTLLLSSILLGASYIILGCLRITWLFFVARLIQGFAAALILTSLPLYIGETATDRYRGPLGSLLTLFLIFGIIYTYALGPYVTYAVLQWCCLATAVLFLVTFCFMPETPYFYAMKSRHKDVLRSLQFLRGHNIDDDEINHIEASVDGEMSKKGSLREIFTVPGYRRALFICCGLSALQQLSGTSVVTLNSQSIFNSTKTNIDPAIATIILGLVQLIANLITPFLIERVGRRVILFISAIGMSLTLFVLGAFFWMQAYGDVSDVLWVPVPALILFNVMYAFGFGPVPFVILGEVFPSNTKSIAISISAAVNWIAGFVSIHWFPELNALGPYYAFWIFGGVCCFAFFFVLIVVIETKGLSLQMIQQELHR